MGKTTDDFYGQLSRLLTEGSNLGFAAVEVNAGQLHRLVGDYPDPKRHRMPVCCDVMLSTMALGDEVVARPPKGKGASLTIRYQFPRVI